MTYSRICNKAVQCLALLTLLGLPKAHATVRLPHLLSDHAVLQRDRPIPVWGWASPVEEVTVTFHGQRKTARADKFGNWEVWLLPEQAGGPYELTVSGTETKETLRRTDLLMGDVWFASGQSNMEMPMNGFTNAPIKNGPEEIAKADHPRIRLLLQTKRTSPYPLSDSEDAWNVCTPATVKTFSAIGYLFAKALADKHHVPIGVIDSTWGGTPAQSWISGEGIAWSNLTSVYLEGGVFTKLQGDAEVTRRNYAEEDARLRSEGKPVSAHGAFAGDHASSYVPATLFNGMVAPYIRNPIKGVIWYQGETDHESLRARNYSRVFPALIQDWRKQWQEGNFPFLFVQIASYDDKGEGWGMVRDAQRRTLELVNTGMASAIDVGEARNIHPADKQTVADRLMRSAEELAYGSKADASSPLLLQTTTEGPAIRAWFAHGQGLHSAADALGDIEVAGSDRRFVPATAKLEKAGTEMTVVATATSVPEPKFMRYAWNGLVTTFVYNSAGLPMSTFTSESDAAMIVH